MMMIRLDTDNLKTFYMLIFYMLNILYAKSLTQSKGVPFDIFYFYTYLFSFRVTSNSPYHGPLGCSTHLVSPS